MFIQYNSNTLAVVVVKCVRWYVLAVAVLSAVCANLLFSDWWQFAVC